MFSWPDGSLHQIRCAPKTREISIFSVIYRWSEEQEPTADRRPGPGHRRRPSCSCQHPFKNDVLPKSPKHKLFYALGESRNTIVASHEVTLEDSSEANHSPQESISSLIPSPYLLLFLPCPWCKLVCVIILHSKTRIGNK